MLRLRCPSPPAVTMPSSRRSCADGRLPRAALLAAYIGALNLGGGRRIGNGVQQAWRAFGHLVPLVVLGLLVAMAGVALLARRRSRLCGKPWLAAVLTVAVRATAIGALILVVAITLQPTGPVGIVGTSPNWVPFATIVDQFATQVDPSVAVRNLLFNVLLFVPVGFTWTLVAEQLNRTWVQAVVAGAGFAVVVETAQLLLPLGRAADVDDVTLNTLGVLGGAPTAQGVRWLVDKHRGTTAAAA